MTVAEPPLLRLELAEVVVVVVVMVVELMVGGMVLCLMDPYVGVELTESTATAVAAVDLSSPYSLMDSSEELLCDGGKCAGGVLRREDFRACSLCSGDTEVETAEPQLNSIACIAGETAATLPPTPPPPLLLLHGDDSAAEIALGGEHV